MSPGDFAALGLHGLAYVRPFRTREGVDVYAIYAADGTQLALAATQELAIATIRQNDLEPASVH